MKETVFFTFPEVSPKHLVKKIEFKKVVRSVNIYKQMIKTIEVHGMTFKELLTHPCHMFKYFLDLGPIFKSISIYFFYFFDLFKF